MINRLEFFFSLFFFSLSINNNNKIKGFLSSSSSRSISDIIIDIIVVEVMNANETVFGATRVTETRGETYSFVFFFLIFIRTKSNLRPSG